MVGRQSTAGYLPQQSQVPIYTPGWSETMEVKCLVQGHTCLSEKTQPAPGFEPGTSRSIVPWHTTSPRRLPLWYVIHCIEEVLLWIFLVGSELQMMKNTSFSQAFNEVLLKYIKTFWCRAKPLAFNGGIEHHVWWKTCTDSFLLHLNEGAVENYQNFKNSAKIEDKVYNQTDCF